MDFEKQVREFFDIDKRLYFIFLCLVTFFVLLMKKNFVELETAAFQVLESEGRMGILNIINAFQYFGIPIWYLWKFTIIGFILWLGSFAFGYKISYAKCWQIAMISETIFILPELMKVGHFTFGSADPTIFDIRAYYPLSLINFMNYENVVPKWHYPLKALNLFEMVYWGILIYGVHLAARKKWEIAALIVFFSYIIIFFLWLWYYLSVYK